MLPLLLGMQMARPAAARTCTMAEVGANYQFHEGTSTDTTKMQYVITNENQLKNLIGCDTIDYILIECRGGCTYLLPHTRSSRSSSANQQGFL